MTSLLILTTPFKFCFLISNHFWSTVHKPINIQSSSVTREKFKYFSEMAPLGMCDVIFKACGAIKIVTKALVVWDFRPLGIIVLKEITLRETWIQSIFSTINDLLEYMFSLNKWHSTNSVTLKPSNVCCVGPAFIAKHVVLIIHFFTQLSWFDAVVFKKPPVKFKMEFSTGSPAKYEKNDFPPSLVPFRHRYDVSHVCAWENAILLKLKWNKNQ